MEFTARRKGYEGEKTPGAQAGKNLPPAAMSKE
jgi:hypothetical protein